ncbi:MAG TPA: UDP-N-acetylglucosamine 1-carboxyvinyltransferase [Candidatus Babeliales bacterium]|jgi:UDP-N-acetylglucosamine 1-carboxyvinyltransferase|nr:UDP-N-acetylglucosamine 1-carboxyvinyltransferase [Candidatus Babeliales bacterium]
MNKEILVVESAGPLSGTMELAGAKNATLVMMIALLLVRGKSQLHNVPNIADVHSMIHLLESLGAKVRYDIQNHILSVDATAIEYTSVDAHIMKQTRASILVLGALLARTGKASVSFPGGDAIGARPIDFHIKGLKKLGIIIEQEQDTIHAVVDTLQGSRIILEYPSVGATENIILAATAAPGITTIINAAIEPEVLDLIQLLCCMGADITVCAPATIHIQGGRLLIPVTYTVMVDRLEAGTLLIATALTGGTLYLPTANPNNLDVVLFKLEEMGHSIMLDSQEHGIRLIATSQPNSVSLKTGPYPNFPTDLQAPILVAQCCATGISTIEETVFENRLSHVKELLRMGAQITATQNKATITGLPYLEGTWVVANDIRASSALVLAGLIARGVTYIDGVSHWRRGYEALEQKLAHLGASIIIQKMADSAETIVMQTSSMVEQPLV